MRILLTDYAWPDLEIERRLTSEAGHELIVSEDAGEASLARLAADCSAIVTTWARVSAAVIDACLDCRVVSRMGIGLDNIDVDHCTTRRIPVTNVPAYCVDEVAEHALALLLALARNVAFFHLRTKRGEYDLSACGEMRRLAGQTLGIAGFGKIGRSLASKAKGLGLEILAYGSGDAADAPGVSYVTFDELLSRSDMISIHLPLTPRTRGLFDAAALARMKPSAVLVNTARGPIVDSAALLTAIESGKLAGAGLDVQDPEPPNLDDPLYRHERVIVTPHAAFTSRESLRTLRETALRQTLDALAGKRPENVVNAVVFN